MTSLHFALAGELAVAEENMNADDELVITSIIELTESMDNGTSYFADRGSYILLSLQSK